MIKYLHGNICFTMASKLSSNLKKFYFHLKQTQYWSYFLQILID